MTNIHIAGEEEASLCTKTKENMLLAYMQCRTVLHVIQVILKQDPKLANYLRRFGWDFALITQL